MNVFMILGRFLFGLIFVLAGINKLMHWDATEQHFVNAMLDTLSHTYEQPWAQNLFDRLLPNASKLLVLATAVEIIGGFLIMLGIQVRLGAVILFLFLIPTTILFHAFWAADGSMREMQTAMFMKNVAIMGGCLILISCGSGGGAKMGKKKSE